MDDETAHTGTPPHQPPALRGGGADAPGRRPSSLTAPVLRRATLTVTEAAAVLGISRSAAYDLVHEGRIPALRLGRRIVVPAHALDDLLHSVDEPT